MMGTAWPSERTSRSEVGYARVIGQPPHGVVEEHGDDVTEAHGAGRMAAAGRGAHVQAGMIELNGLGVDGGFE